jgi:hypothetical protein
MGKVVVSENVSLDGVVQDPAGDEGFRRGGWVGLIAAREDVAKVALEEALGAEALLLGSSLRASARAASASSREMKTSIATELSWSTRA